jgi:hypothetical protein
MKRFLSYLGGTILEPRETFAALSVDQGRYGHGLKLLLLMLVPWSFVALVWLSIGSKPYFPVLLKIPDEDYYFWECLFGLPLMILPLILVASAVHLLSRALKGNNTLEGFLPLFLFSLVVPLLLFCTNDVVLATLNLTRVLPHDQLREAVQTYGLVFCALASLNVVAMIWQISLMALAVEMSYKLSRGKALFVSVMSVPLYQFWLVIFFR